MFKIINGDCYEQIPKIHDNSIDLIFTDPPYNIDENSTGLIDVGRIRNFNEDIGDWDQSINIPFLSKEFTRILKDEGNIFVFCNYSQFGLWHQELEKYFDRTNFFVWHKRDPTVSVRKTSFLNSCEIIICAWNGGHIWNFKEQKNMHNFFETSVCKGKERLQGKYYHPTQKPIKLLAHLIEIASNRDGLVFDPFMGIGSVGVAAMRQHRQFFGIEKEKIFYEGAFKRLNIENQRLGI